jgi:hypothetical protein
MVDKVRHRTFITYHQEDQDEVDEFIKTFDHERDVFIARAVGSDETMEDLVGGDDDDYIMRQIREKYLNDTTVTLAFIGERTWTRKFVDWELAASLHQGPSAGKPNGLLAILSPKLTKAILPDRFVDNWQPGYAHFYPYPKNRTQLSNWIEEAFKAREDEKQRELIKNGRRKLRRNLSPDQPAGRPTVQPKPDGSYSDPNKAARTAAVATGTAAATRSATPRPPYLHCDTKR